MRALKIAATGMQAQQMRVEVISNNLANMSTTAYNPRRAEFSDLHYEQVQRAGAVNASDGTVLPAGESSLSTMMSPYTCLSAHGGGGATGECIG